MASGDKAKWPRQVLTCNKFSPACGKQCTSYVILTIALPLEKHLTRNCIHNIAKLLEVSCSPTFLSISLTSSFLPLTYLLPKAQTPLPQLRVSPTCFSPLFQSASIPNSVSMPFHCKPSQTGLPAACFIPITTGSLM